MANFTSAPHNTVFDFLLVVLFAEYAIIFVVGTVGNLWVLRLVTTLFARSSFWRRKHSLPEHLYVYIGALSTVDLLVLSVVPFIMIQMNDQQWRFGTLVCKYFWTMENVNKLLSISILAVLSVDRYLAVCQQLWCPWIRQTKISLLVVSGCAAIAVLELSPVILYSGVEKVEFVVPVNVTITVETCAFNQNVTEVFMRVFIVYLFVLGYCIPLVVMTVCYSRLLIFVRSHSFRSRQQTANSSIRNSDDYAIAPEQQRAPFNLLANLTKSVLRVVLFHFACWTPYWVFTLIPLLNQGSQTFAPTFVMIHQFVHSLPYVNSAGNWIFYALMNKNLVDIGRSSSVRRRRARSELVDTSLAPQTAILKERSHNGHAIMTTNL